MKKKNDPRHQRRIRLMQALYSAYFHPSNQIPSLAEEDKSALEEIATRRDEINHQIDTYAVKFSSEKMSRIDLAILQLALYELMYEKTEPYRVIIDESIELAKEFGSMNSPKFVNGILGKIVEEIEPQDNDKTATS